MLILACLLKLQCELDVIKNILLVLLIFQKNQNQFIFTNYTPAHVPYLTYEFFNFIIFLDVFLFVFFLIFLFFLMRFSFLMYICRGGNGPVRIFFFK